MFGTIFSDISWNKVGNIGAQLRLLSFSEKQPSTWESYWTDQRKYWGADEPDKKRVSFYFGEHDTEQKLLADSKKKYSEFKEYLLHWNGLCKIGEVVQVILREANITVLSKNWKGEISDHSDLEIWLKEEKTFIRRHIRYCCEIYSFGTRVIPRGSIEAQMGEPVGSFRVSHQHGKNETIEFDSGKGTLTISDAKFHIVD